MSESPNTQELERMHPAVARDILIKERDTLRQQLLACEASRERLKNALEGMSELCGNYFDETQLVCARDQELWKAMLTALNEPPSTAFAEYLRPVIHLLEEVAELDSGEQPCIASDAKKVLALLTALGKEKV